MAGACFGAAGAQTVTDGDTIKLDGRLLKYAKKHKLDPIVAP